MIIVFDLDDTLYNEIDFVKSGLRSVSTLFDNSNDVYDALINIYELNGSGKIFDTFLNSYQSTITVNDCIEQYRNHLPDISMTESTKQLLGHLSKIHTLGLLTDGNADTQKNKFKALDLDPYFDLAIFSGDHQLSKPDLRLFNMFETHFSTESNFYYIADNPKKDFYGPNQLGWTSIQILNPVGIYRNIVPKDGYNASLILNSLDDLTPIFDPN